MSAELLREAAQAMREAARNAEASRYVSTWQHEFPPAAALAVADWLDQEALDSTRPPVFVAPPALAVARAFLGRAS